MMHVNQHDGLTRSEAKFISRRETHRAQRQRHERPLSLCSKKFPTTRAHPEAVHFYGLNLRWEKVRTDMLTIQDSAEPVVASSLHAH
jgi:hypothetical protein